MNPLRRLLRAIQGPFAAELYCPSCGGPLVRHTKLEGFDPWTGKPREVERVDCALILFGGPFPKGHPTRPNPARRGY